MTEFVAFIAKEDSGKAVLSVYSSKTRNSRPTLPTIRSAAVLKVGVSYVWKMTKFVASYSQSICNKFDEFISCIFHHHPKMKQIVIQRLVLLIILVVAEEFSFIFIAS